MQCILHAEQLDSDQNAQADSRFGLGAHVSRYVLLILRRIYLYKKRCVCPLTIAYITKTCLYNFDPLKPHFNIVKLVFTGVYIIFFLFLLKNIDCGYPLEPPWRGGSNDYP